MQASSESGLAVFTADELLPAVYQDLRRLAAARIAAEPAGLTLHATDLVHESYLRLKQSSNSDRWNNRAHFYVAAAESMRRILIERARRRQTHKLGGGRSRSPLDDVPIECPGNRLDLLALDEALAKLEAVSERYSRLVKLRYFAGLSIDQTAEVMGVSPSTIDADWRFAKSWLKVEMGESGPD